MTPQIALAMLLLSNLALLVLYIHMEREIEKLRKEPKNLPVSLGGARLYNIHIDYDERNHLYAISGVFTKEDLMK